MERQIRHFEDQMKRAHRHSLHCEAKGRSLYPCFEEIVIRELERNPPYRSALPEYGMNSAIDNCCAERKNKSWWSTHLFRLNNGVAVELDRLMPLPIRRLAVKLVRLRGRDVR